MVQKTAGPDDAGMRLSRFVLKNTWQLPDSMLYKSFRKKRIKVNGRAAGPDARLCAGDVVSMYLNDAFFENAPPAGMAARPGPVLGPEAWGVVYEDARLGILYKAGGVPCHPDGTHGPDLLSSYTRALIERGEYDPAQSAAFSPALCNRLDKGTEGLLIAAKRYASLREMNGLIRDGLLEKEYLCITLGPPKAQGLCTAYHYRDKAARTVTVRPRPFEGAKEIKTGVQVLETKGPYALNQITLYTGKTHQIRAHLACLDAPILGDRRYGPATEQNRYPGPGIALCAHRLAFGPGLSPQSGFADLAGRAFTANQARLPGQWRNL